MQPKKGETVSGKTYWGQQVSGEVTEVNEEYGYVEIDAGQYDDGEDLLTPGERITHNISLENITSKK
jgi:hypothetical protein